MKFKHICTDPKYATAKADYEAMGVALGKVNARIAEVEALIRSHAPNPVEDQVAAAMKFAETGKVTIPANVTALHDEHVALRVQRDAVVQAMNVRRDDLARITGEISFGVCKELRAEHRKLATRYAQLLRDLDAMHEEEAAFMRAIEDQGYTLHFPGRLDWFYVGRLSQKSESTLWHHLREVERLAA